MRSRDERAKVPSGIAWSAQRDQEERKRKRERDGNRETIEEDGRKQSGRSRGGNTMTHRPAKTRAVPAGRPADAQEHARVLCLSRNNEYFRPLVSPPSSSPPPRRPVDIDHSARENRSAAPNFPARTSGSPGNCSTTLPSARVSPLPALAPFRVRRLRFGSRNAIPPCGMFRNDSRARACTSVL